MEHTTAHIIPQPGTTVITVASPPIAYTMRSAGTGTGTGTAAATAGDLSVSTPGAAIRAAEQEVIQGERADRRNAALTELAAAIAAGKSGAYIQNLGGWLVARLEELGAMPASIRWQSRQGRALLACAVIRYAGVARRENMDRLDVVEAVWNTWTRVTDNGRIMEPSILGARNAWALTAIEITRRLSDEGEAQRKLTTPKGLRHVDMQEFQGFSELRDTDLLPDPGAAPDTDYKTLALITARTLIIKHGHSDVVADSIIEAMIVKAAESNRPKGAVDRLVRETKVPEALGMAAADWRALTMLLFGSTRGAMGLIEAERLGIDPSTVENIQRATARFGLAA